MMHDGKWIFLITLKHKSFSDTWSTVSIFSAYQLIINLNSKRNSNSGINKNLVINISRGYKSPQPEEMLLTRNEVRMKADEGR